MAWVALNTMLWTTWLICTDGWPTSAAWTLLETLRTTGARLHYHGDFDWDGVRIARVIRNRFGAEPWRFDAQSYREGIIPQPEPHAPLDGRAPRDEADADLGRAMEEMRFELHEEAVLDQLLNDLSPK